MAISSFLTILCLVYLTILLVLSLTALIGLRQFPRLAHFMPLRSPSVSIVVPVKDEPETLVDCIRSLLELDYLNKEVIVVNGVSSDTINTCLGNFRGRIEIIEDNNKQNG